MTDLLPMQQRQNGEGSGVHEGGPRNGMSFAGLSEAIRTVRPQRLQARKNHKNKHKPRQQKSLCSTTDTHRGTQLKTQTPSTQHIRERLSQN
ncbi:hypothetical protein VC83_01826 [Pseudogymnoascus destructans]|uniref:Uncharacterized protein n=2 Tax=Pseudogymnoascus destructans TaxID=655981 RepID=L8FWE2_PSED2|nr:uncharacterized protein VC83_01826 [Pseudogymnoascus destructans]ELR05192.1 hypothetical protein GMDG_07233 [Pseudogymnoascus destructans 20631-21]OAF61645.1 hypothetical protein VC83_01826 [Pseudogymnoascus destructans]